MLSIVNITNDCEWDPRLNNFFYTNIKEEGNRFENSLTEVQTIQGRSWRLGKKKGSKTMPQGCNRRSEVLGLAVLAGWELECDMYNGYLPNPYAFSNNPKMCTNFQSLHSLLELKLIIRV